MTTRMSTLLLLTAGLFAGFSLSLGPGVLADREPEAPETLPWQDARLLAEVLQRVKADYVDTVTDQQLLEAAVRGMVAGLDPHSAFLDADEYEEIRVSTTGNYSGVGIEVTLEGGRVIVVSPIEDTPAARAGIGPGDEIVSVNGVPVDPVSIGNTIDRMRGAPGTDVRVTIARAADGETLDYVLTRASVQVHSVKHELLEPGYGYIRITHFSETTPADLDRAIADLEKSADGALLGLVLDLRNNPGGVLESAVSVSDAFLDHGVIVKASGRTQDACFVMDAHPGDMTHGARMVVLVNGGSASASEIVAGALKDHRRATLMGRRTYGKGSVQTVMPLSDGRAIKLTTSRYYTPSGKSIHEKGIMPDIVIDPPSSETSSTRSATAGNEAGAVRDYEIGLALANLKNAGLQIRQSRIN